MASRMIDIQQIVARAAEDTQRVHQTQHQAPRTQQEQRSYQVVEEQEIRRKQTQETNRPEEQKIRDQADFAKQRRYIPRRKAKSDKKEIKEDLEEQKLYLEKYSKYSKIIDVKV